MKRIIAAVLILTALLGCTGCAQNRGTDTAQFYYRRAEFQYGSSSGVIASEKRRLSGQPGDLNYLMTLYLLGPSSDKLELPFPEGTTLESAEQHGSEITIVLKTGKTLTDSEWTLGSSCIALTCFAYTDAESVNVSNERKNLTIQKDTIVYMDEGLLN